MPPRNALPDQLNIFKDSSALLQEYALRHGKDVAFVGDGAGHVHCVDVAGANTGGVPRVAFALGAHRGATRALVATRDGKLCAAGDDGRVASYAFV